MQADETDWQSISSAPKADALLSLSRLLQERTRERDEARDNLCMEEDVSRRWKADALALKRLLEAAEAEVKRLRETLEEAMRRQRELEREVTGLRRSYWNERKARLAADKREKQLEDAAGKLLASVDRADPEQHHVSTVAYAELQYALADRARQAAQEGQER